MKLPDKIDNSIIRSKAGNEDIPIMDFILNKIKMLPEHSTIFAACPNSESVLKASIRAAKRANAPIKFAATLNQVDLDGGYTGWSQDVFVKKIKEECARYGFEGPVIVAIDHGGPWLKDLHSINNLSLDQTMKAIKNSFEAAILAGYDLIHVDPTVDRASALGENISIDTVAKRTIELIVHTEEFRRRKNLPRISYEVGTEEVHGGLADMAVFRKFLELLKQGLKQNGFEDTWPCFIVGKVGTDLHTAFFDPKTASELSAEAARFNSLIKGHYTDSVDNPGDYPKAGMGGANVGPEFTEAEYEALAELVDMEETLFQSRFIAQRSCFASILKDAVIKSGRWKKWLKGDEQGKDFQEISLERQTWLVKTGCRYIWADHNVQNSRNILYKNLQNNGIAAEERVLLKIETVMDKYFREFNLINLNSRIQQII
ncbi:MAG: class II D-tagatose-bisphosphate aldolase, non-catalytic subunit [bacterium]